MFVVSITCVYNCVFLFAMVGFSVCVIPFAICSWFRIRPVFKHIADVESYGAFFCFSCVDCLDASTNVDIIATKRFVDAVTDALLK